MRLIGRRKEADARTAYLQDGASFDDAGPDRGDRPDARDPHGAVRDGQVPEDWDDVLLPDDELPVGIPAAAKQVASSRAGSKRRSAVQRASSPARTLLLMTSLAAIDGTIFLLAATGRLSSWAAAVVVGLTVVSGIGAWIAAYNAFGGRRPGRRDYQSLARMAGISIAATVASAWAGVTLGQAVTFHILPKAAGVVLFLIAAEVWGLRLPRLAHVPMPLAVVAAAGILEVLLWIP